MLLPRLNVILGFIACTVLFYFNQSLPWSTVAVVVLVGLVTIARVVENKVPRVDEAADSLYFLGFVVTLLSLFVAFMKFPGFDYSEGGADKGINELFAIIGSGLSTTIAGLMMRELISMAGARKPVVDVGQVTAEDVKRVVDSLNSALALGSEAVEVSRTAADSAAAYRDTFSSYSTYLDEYTAHLRSFHENIVTPMDGIKDELTDSLSGIKNNLGQIRGAFGSTAIELSEVAGGLESLRSELTKVANYAPPLCTDLRAAVEDSTASLEVLSSQYAELTKALDHDFSGLDTIANALPSVASGIGGLQSGINDAVRAAESLAGIEKHLKQFSASIPGSFDAVVSSSGRLGSQIDELTVRYRDLISALSRDYDQLVAIAEGLPGDKILKPFTHIADTLPGVAAHLRNSTKSLEESSSRLDVASQAFYDSQSVFRSLVGAIDAAAMQEPPQPSTNPTVAAPPTTAPSNTPVATPRPRPATTAPENRHAAARLNGTASQLPASTEPRTPQADGFNLPPDTEVTVPGKTPGVTAKILNGIGRFFGGK